MEVELSMDFGTNSGEVGQPPLPRERLVHATRLGVWSFGPVLCNFVDLVENCSKVCSDIVFGSLVCHICCPEHHKSSLTGVLDVLET